MISTIICDMDGLLADSETLHLKGYQRTLAHYGVTLTDQEYIDHWIRDGLGVAEFIENNQLSIDPAEARAYKMIQFWELLETDLKEMPYATDFLERMSGSYRLLLASNSFKKNVLHIIEKLGMTHFFEMCAFHESVTNRKPAPDIFLYLSDALSIDPTECVVIEDAQKGIIAAHSANMKSIAVPNCYTEDNDFSLADRVVQSLKDIDKNMLDAL